MTKRPEKPIIITDLHPRLSWEEQGEAMENIRAYVGVVKRIFDRLRSEGQLKNTLLRHQYDKRN
jgi:hypothetical protein